MVNNNQGARMQTARRGRGRGRIAAVEWRGSSPAFAKLAAKHNWGTASNNDASSHRGCCNLNIKGVAVA